MLVGTLAVVGSVEGLVGAGVLELGVVGRDVVGDGEDEEEETLVVESVT